MDTVELLVRDLDTMLSYYHGAVSLDILDQSGATATLGRGGMPIMLLSQQKDLPPFDPRGAGLYHTAIVFDGQRRLASSVLSLAQHAPHTFTGASDHLVSEAFYFTDPEGNGLELYHDRPREQWTVSPEGLVTMAADPVDPNAYLRQWYDPNTSDDGVTAAIGHVHLQVGDIPSAKAFYVGVLGFDITVEFPTALFVAAGGYHHHIGMNTWHSAGAGPRAATLGLGDVRILVPTADDVHALADRLRFHEIPAHHDGRTLRFQDPWGTALAVTPETAV